MGKAKAWVEANFPSATGTAKGSLILAYGAGLDAGLAEAQELLLSVMGDGCNDAAGSKVAQVRSGLDLPDQSQSNSLSSANDPD